MRKAGLAPSRAQASGLFLVYLALGLAAPSRSQAGETFTTLAPCRVVDTRQAGGPLAAGEIRNFRVTGDLADQGGAAGGCGVPTNTFTGVQGSYPTAVMLNFVAVDPKGPGDLRAWAFSDPPVGPPLASVLNYAAAPGLNLANGIMVPICQNKNAWSTFTCAADIRVLAEANGTSLVVDVVGYFSPTGVTPLSSATTSDLVVTPGDCIPLGLSIPAGRFDRTVLYHFPPPIAYQTLRVEANLDSLLPASGTIEVFFAPFFGAPPCQGTPVARYTNPQSTPARLYVPVRQDLYFYVMQAGTGMDVSYDLMARYTGTGQAVIASPSTLQGLWFH